MAIELASPLFPAAFLLLACLGSLARAVTGVAGGATRAALTMHFARQRNAADIAAKEGSQAGARGSCLQALGLAATRSARLSFTGTALSPTRSPTLRAKTGASFGI